MLEPALEGLAVADGGVYIDATAGAGGHSEAILQGLGADGRLIAIDRDAEAIELRLQQPGPRAPAPASPKCGVIDSSDLQG